MARIFLAINLPTDIKQEFKQIQGRLKQINPNLKASWVEPEIAHINLHFLGEIPEQKLNSLKQGLFDLTKKFNPLKLSLTGVGGFPNQTNPRVLFLGVKETDSQHKLLKIHQQSAQIIKKQNFNIDNRPFIAHVTLCRIKQSENNIQLLGEEMPDIFFKANSIELMQSTLTKEGPEYKILQSYEL